MICPDCGGAGRIRKRFLLFFTRRARCRRCLGTGEFPPPMRGVVQYGTQGVDDDRDVWPAATTLGSGSSGSRTPDDSFDVGSGGRSGGGGAAASWGDAPADSAPVIVDPFAGGSSSAVSTAVAADVADSGPSDSGSSSSGSSDSGTAY